MSVGDWLNAIERMVNISRGVNFDKVNSIYRHLIDDEEEKRRWCVTKYTPYIQIYDWMVNILHFAFSFSINCISGIIIIILATRTRSSVQKKQSYRAIL